MSSSSNKRHAHISRRIAQNSRSIVGKHLLIIYQLGNICKYVNEEDMQSGYDPLRHA